MKGIPFDFFRAFGLQEQEVREVLPPMCPSSASPLEDAELIRTSMRCLGGERRKCEAANILLFPQGTFGLSTPT
jgi:hypothetical protein